MVGSLAVPGKQIEVTLQAIHGIVSESDISDVTATVAFTGSASSMQISSFSMCGRTGNLVIESKALEAVADECQALTGASPKENSQETVERSRQQFIATFNDPTGGRRSIASCSQSTSSSSLTSRPHLQLRLSPSTPIPQNELLMKGGETRSSTPASDKNASVDIVELYITLRNRDYSVCVEGITHIIFEGQQRCTTKTVDLLIQENPIGSSCPPIWFAQDAYIRVDIGVATENHPVPSPDEILLSENLYQTDMDSLILKLKEQEELVEARDDVSKRRFPQTEKGAQRRVFCNSGLDFGETLRGIMDALTRCDRSPGKRRKGRGFIPILRCNSTMDSTIETRESLKI